MFIVVVVIHLMLCVSLMGLVLLQQGKGADAGAITGGGTDSLLGAGSAGNFVSKLTTGLAISFMITSIILVKFYDRGMAMQGGTGQAVDLLQGSVMGDGLSVEMNQAPADAVEQSDAPDTAAEGGAAGSDIAADQEAAPEPEQQEAAESGLAEGGDAADNVVSQ